MLPTIDGNWGSWGKWTDCSKACGTGKQSRFRICNKPAPTFDGKQCAGSYVEDANCNTEACPSKEKRKFAARFIDTVGLLFEFLVNNL